MKKDGESFHLTQRDGMRAIAIWLACASLGTGIGYAILDSINDPTIEENLGVMDLLTSEQLRLLDEIGEYRKPLALSGLPAHLSEQAIDEAAKIDWEIPKPETAIEISSAHQSSAQQAIRILQLLFGDNGKWLVDKVVANQDMLSLSGFDSNSKTLNVETEKDPSSLEFLQIIIHELIHSLDPSFPDSEIYPLEVLIKVSHGLARVQSQAGSVDGMFLNNREAYNVPAIKKGIGEGIANLFKDGNEIFVDVRKLESQVDFEGQRLIMQTLGEIAIDQKVVDINDLKFTKKACYQLGELLFPKIMDQSIKISGPLMTDWYSPRVEASMGEIVADMISVAMMSPEKIGGNQEIYLGIEEILTAIQGRNVDIASLMEELHAADENIQDRYASEQAATITYAEQALPTPSEQLPETASRPQPVATPIASPLPSSEIEEIQKELARKKSTQEVIMDFMHTGEVPNEIGADDIVIRDTMERYGVAISTVHTQFPSILNGLSADNISFDPYLNIWDTAVYEEAWNFNVFANLLTDPSIIPKNLTDIERRINLLNEFINDPAFNNLEGTTQPTSKIRNSPSQWLVEPN